MKAIVVEGYIDAMVIKALFPDLSDSNINIREGQGFSNVLAVSKSLIDYGCEVLAVLDTDTHRPGNDNREIVKRMQSTGLAGRPINILWMDPCLEKVLLSANSKMNLRFEGKGGRFIQEIKKNRNRILELNEFKKIKSFIEEKQK